MKGRNVNNLHVHYAVCNNKLAISDDYKVALLMSVYL